MKNESLPSAKVADLNAGAGQVDVKPATSAAWYSHPFFRHENAPALVTLAILTCITAGLWALFLRAVEQHMPGSITPVNFILPAAMFGLSMLLNLFIFFLIAFAVREHNRASRLASTMAEVIASQTREIKFNEERLELAILSAKVGVWERNIELGTVYFSPRWKLMLGYGESDFVNSEAEWLKRVHPDDVALISRDASSFLEKNWGRLRNEYRLRHRDGNYIWVEDIGLVLRDAGGKLTRLVGVMRDINEQKRVEKLKGEYISTVSHELRTPLTSIAASLGLLEAGVFGELPSKVMGLVNIAHKNSKRLTGLVNDILDMEKLQAGKTEFRLDEIDLVELIGQAIELNSEFASSVGVNVALSLSEASRNVIADKDRLLQAMSNLLSNAVKFSKRGGDVRIRISQQDKFAKVEIEDHGTGIPEEFLGRMFGEFAQADGRDSRQYGGTGLGLHITKKLVERMGGEIGYETEFGAGSTFWFTLPSSSTWNFGSR